MLDIRLAPIGRPRMWLVDALVGGAAALVAITVAHAALPAHGERLAAHPLRPTVAAASKATTEPAYLIAFAEPVPGSPVISPFGLRKLPWEEGGRLHEGVDIAGQSGQAVLATADGVVTRAGVDGGYGRFVELEHAEGVKSFYAHLGAVDPSIVSGVAVKSGATVGRMGSTGVSTGPHLHFEIRDASDRPLNPAYFLGRRFATADDLPLAKAARVSRSVRLAYVSRIPDSKRELMEARKDAKDATKLAALDAGAVTRISGRPVGRIAGAAPIEDRKALVAQIAARQRAEIAAEAAAQAPEPILAPTGTAVDAVSRVTLDGADTAS